MHRKNLYNVVISIDSPYENVVYLDALGSHITLLQYMLCYNRATTNEFIYLFLQFYTDMQK